MKPFSPKSYADLGLEFQDESVARNYELGRASYAAETVELIISAHAGHSIDRNSQLVIAEPGAGTGLLTADFMRWNLERNKIAAYVASDPSKTMLAAMIHVPVLRDAMDTGTLRVFEHKITENYAPVCQTDIIVTGQSKHWDTRLGKIDESVKRTLGFLKPGGAEFAVYNAPIDRHSGFTTALNHLLNTYCPDPYYQAMTSGDPGLFLGEDAKSNFAAYFNKLAERGNGEVFYAALPNLSEYKTANEIIAYVFSNAFVKRAIEADGKKEHLLTEEIKRLFTQHKGESPEGVYYGNTTLIVGARGLNLPQAKRSGMRLPERATGANDFSLK